MNATVAATAPNLVIRLRNDNLSSFVGAWGFDWTEALHARPEAGWGYLNTVTGTAQRPGRVLGKCSPAVHRKVRHRPYAGAEAVHPSTLRPCASRKPPDKRSRDGPRSRLFTTQGAAKLANLERSSRQHWWRGLLKKAC